MNIRVNIVKVKYEWKDKDQCVYGVELRFAPKVKKFLSMNQDTKELLDLMGNGLARWFDRADFGDDIMLSLNIPDNPREVVVDPRLNGYDNASQDDKSSKDSSNFWN